MKQKYNKDKKFTIELTEEEIAIVKAGLQYYWLDDEFGYGLWGTIPGACFGSSDSYYRRRVGAIYDILDEKPTLSQIMDGGVT